MFSRSESGSPLAEFDNDAQNAGFFQAAVLEGEEEPLPTATAALVAGLADELGARPTARPMWEASTPFDAFTTIFAAGHTWEADAGGGTSGASEPDWPSGFGSTVDDNDITWTDAGAIEGSAHVYVQVVLPAVP